MTRAGLVRSTLWLTTPEVQRAAEELWFGPGLIERYPHYLVTMHGLVRASVPLMETAVRRCRELAGRERFAGQLLDYLEQHIEEERGHDDWLLSDLSLIDPDAAGRLQGRAPAAEVAALAGAQYYWIHHFHPACLLGYIAVLEGCAPRADLVDQLPALTGWPAPAFRTLAGHAVLDPGHVRALDRVLDGLPADPQLAAAVARSVAHTAAGAGALLRLTGRRGRTASGPGRTASGPGRTASAAP